MHTTAFQTQMVVINFKIFILIFSENIILFNNKK